MSQSAEKLSTQLAQLRARKDKVREALKQTRDRVKQLGDVERDYAAEVQMVHESISDLKELEYYEDENEDDEVMGEWQSPACDGTRSNNMHTAPGQGKGDHDGDSKGDGEDLGKDNGAVGKRAGEDPPSHRHLR